MMGLQESSSIATASNGSVLRVEIVDDSSSPVRSSESPSTRLVKTLSPRRIGGWLERIGLVLYLTKSACLFVGDACIGDEDFFLAATEGSSGLEAVSLGGAATGCESLDEIFVVGDKVS